MKILQFFFIFGFWFIIKLNSNSQKEALDKNYNLYYIILYKII